MNFKIAFLFIAILNLISANQSLNKKRSFSQLINIDSLPIEDLQNQLFNLGSTPIKDLQNKLIELFLENAAKYNFSTLVKNFFISLGLKLDFISPNSIQLNINSTQTIVITLNDNPIYNNWIYLNKNFTFNLPVEFVQLNLTECFRSDGKKLAFSQYWIQPLEYMFFSFSLIDFLDLNLDVSYNCFYNYSNNVMTATMASTTLIPSTVISMKMSLNLLFTNDYYNLTSDKSIQLINNYTSFVKLKS